MPDEYTNSDISDQKPNESEKESDIAKQVHSLTFVKRSLVNGQYVETSKNTWDDWHLVPTSRPVFDPPELKKYSQDIPGGNGSIDLTTTLTGYPSYQNRTGSIEFLAMHNGLSSSLGEGYGYNNFTNVAWNGIYSNIMNFLHGARVKVETEDIADYYFWGRVTVEGWESEEQYSKITFNYDLEPFRYSITDSSNLWKWDPFNFETGVIRTYSKDRMAFDSSAYKDFHIDGTNTPVSPTIFVSTPAMLKTPDGEFTLEAGNNKSPLILVYPGSQTWSFKATTADASGNAAIYFRERSF